jgi:hypothetical protein
MGVDDRLARRIAMVAFALVVVVAGAVRARHADSTTTTVSPTTTAESRARFEFTESIGAPLPPEGHGPDFDRALITVSVVNHGRSTRVSNIRPVGEPGLVVDYLGYADCRRGGCPGAGHNDPETMSIVTKVLDGTLPLFLETDKSALLIFALKVTPDGLRTFSQRCLRFQDVEFTLADSSRHVVRYGGTLSVGAVLATPPPPGYLECQPE